jgi:hypothetical protein
MALSDPKENKPGRYTVDGMAVKRPDDTALVKLGDDISPQSGEQFLDLTERDSVIVASYDTGTGVVMINVVGSTKMDRIDAETLDKLLEDTLTIPS